MRAAIYIDAGYLLKQTPSNHVPDYSKLADFLLKPIRKQIPVDLLRCYFYYCAPWAAAEPTDDQQKRLDDHEKFFSEINSLNRWQFRLGKLERRMDNGREYFEQKRVDVFLSIDMVKHAAAGHIQHAVLLAGDSDFIPAVAAAKESGVTVTLWCGATHRTHKDLIALCDEVYHIDWKKLPKLQKNSNQSSTPKTTEIKEVPKRTTKKKPSKVPNVRKNTQKVATDDAPVRKTRRTTKKVAKKITKTRTSPS